MMYLITGGSASGKSAYAEQLAVSLGSRNRFYIATMQPYGEEGRRRVEKHRAMRAGKGFLTVECQTQLAGLCLPVEGCSSVPAGKAFSDESGPTVLLECMSNLVANEQFDIGGTQEEIIRRIMDGIRHLKMISLHQILVTNEVFSDGTVYGEETQRYLRILGTVNACLARQADHVTEVVYGIPVSVK